MLKMVRRKGSIFGSKSGSVLVRQLLGVKANAKAVVGRGLKEAFNFFPRKGDRLAKGIDAACKSLRGRSRNELVDDLADIVRASVPLVCGQSMKGKQGRNDPNVFVLS
jgi:hypothetical protein